MKPFSLALYMALTAAALAQPSAARPPIVPGGETRHLTEHTYAIEDKDTTPGVPNIGFVVGTRGVLVIDTGMGPRNGRTVLAEAEKLAAGKQIYLVTTHVHPEHDLGAEAFPATTKMIRSADQEEDIRHHGYDLTKVFIARSPVNAELLNGAKFRTSDIHFDKEYTLELGGVTVRIFATGPDHTLGDTAIWVPSERVLFSGDVAMRGLPSFIPPDSSLQQLATEPGGVCRTEADRSGAKPWTGWRCQLHLQLPGTADNNPRPCGCLEAAGANGGPGGGNAERRTGATVQGHQPAGRSHPHGLRRGAVIDGAHGGEESFPAAVA
ncbi:MBL fold metallo-hydrolase [Terriglobus tenax]|uniref:MBL fold metallo-hydrolase n=1 Tax=Terriglobus tenax TaxID=1111115 RepID=UPI0021E06D41|nr:MBL fold metallo-hydrolase [Terriglobus tenax]